MAMGPKKKSDLRLAEEVDLISKKQKKQTANDFNQ
jgi:hypothetical protein